MPPVSEKQRKAMWAAAEGRSTLGIPRSVGKEYVGEDAEVPNHAAGILFVAPDGDVLLLHRARTEKNFGGHWALPGGGAEAGERPQDTARREADEELGGMPPNTQLRRLDKRQTPNGLTFHTFAARVPEKFTPQLNAEHSGYTWAGLNALPRPMHPAVARTLREQLGAQTGDAAADMSPEDWDELRTNFMKWLRDEADEPEHKSAADPVNWGELRSKFAKFFSEEEREPEHAEDAEWEEGKHPRAENGEFGKGSSSENHILNYINPGHANHATKLNAALRSGATLNPSQKDAVRSIDKAIADSEPFKQNKTLYRGFDAGSNKFQPDTSFRDPGFMSTSDVLDTAMTYAEGRKGGVVLEISAPAGTRALSTAEHDTLFFGGESEYVLPRGSYFIVRGSRKENGVKVVKVEYKRSSLFGNEKTATDTVVMDRATVRHTDQDGHMHVEMTPISKAVVNPYYGREIPDYERLGLDPDKMYQLLRHPDELKKAAASFAGKPLLHTHTPVSADDHPKDVVVGTVGDDVQWDPPYLKAPLRVWDGAAIKAIESGKQKQLSCGYRYVPDMTPGTYQGEHYDGVMRDIIGNHVALVEEGRAGPDVMVGDSKPQDRWAGRFAQDAEETDRDRAEGKLNQRERSVANKTPSEREDIPASVFLEPGSRKYPVKEKKNGGWAYSRDLLLAAARRARMQGKESLAARADAIRKREFEQAKDHKETTMAKIVLTRKAAVAQGALMTYLAPKLANDANINLVPALRGLTRANYATRKAQLAADVKALVKDKLTGDADIDDLTNLLDALEKVEPAEDDELEPNAGTPVDGEDEDDDDEDDKDAAKRKFLEEKLSAEDLAAFDALEDDDDDDDDDDGKQEALDEETEEERRLKEGETKMDARKAKDRRAHDRRPAGLSKMAVDAAINNAVAAERERARAVALALDEVAPYVGRLAAPGDKAADVYRSALEAMNVDVSGIHPSAFRALLRAHPVPGAATSQPTSLGMDSKGVVSFQELYPETKTHHVNTL